MQRVEIVHPFPPFVRADSEILILGSFPSVKTRESGFFYGHPRNRMWPVLAMVMGEETPMGTDARRDFLLRHRIAMWDVLSACTIQGADDGSIRDPEPNDLSPILSAAQAEEGTRDRAVFVADCEANRIDDIIVCLHDEGLELVALHDRPEGSALGTYHYVIEVENPEGVTQAQVEAALNMEGMRFAGRFNAIEKR